MLRFFSTIVNIIAAIIAVITLSIVQVEFSNHNVVEVLNTTSFEETETFKNLFNERVNEVFNLIQLKNVFETNDEINYSALVAESIDKDSGIKKWTIADCLNEAKAHGLTIDTEYNVVVSDDSNAIPLSRSKLYNFMLKLYPSRVRIGAQSEEEFLTEFVTSIATYYKASRDLNKELSNFKYLVKFQDDDKELTYKNTSLSEKEMNENRLFVYMSSLENVISSSLNFVDRQLLNSSIQNTPHPDMEFKAYYAIDSNYTLDDAFNKAFNEYNRIKNNCSAVIMYAILSCTAFIITLIISLIFILQTKKVVEESKKIFVQIPTEIYILCYFFIIIILLLITHKFIKTTQLFGYDFSKVLVNFYVLSVYIPSAILMVIFASKYANDTLTPAAIKAIRDNNEKTINPRTLFFGTFIPILAFILISAYLIHVFAITNDVNFLIIAFFIFVATLSFTIYILYLYHAFNEAIDVETRSNEMRTTLITNVTHDIKTPLTSIMNYAEIITDEINNPNEDSKENLAEYSKALIGKSKRLNELINDLIFDSKISSGNIELDMQKLDLNAFINQCIAEFGGKLEEKDLKVIYENNASKSIIFADSAHLYRVFQNLFSNIYKYALENSRVYIDLNSTKSKISITMKNIQKEKLEVDVMTLKNRFVRGSKSRSTEGFGLGLSITDNLIKSMNGTLDIKNKKDEFTTIITFLLYEQ